MSTGQRRLGFVCFAALTLCAAGCFGGSQNPSYFPYLLPTGDVIRTHAKPIGPGYYANFDPHAIDLAVEPQVMTSQVGSQVVILATVRDEKGTPRRNRRIDWIVTGGNLIEVDESGHLPGRGGKEGNTGWSYTSYGEHRLSRGNANKADDVMIRPGQSWCVVSSPVEGDTHVQVVVPGIYNWERRMKTTVIRWVDATWELPPRAVAKYNTEHEFVTRISRFTDRQPLAKYRVRYKILEGGPPAVLLPSQALEDVVTSDLSGLAKIKIKQTTPASGTNRVLVEVIRPPDPTTPSGSGVTIITGETSVEWIGPDIRFSHSGPPVAAIGQDIVYTTIAKNEGRIDSQAMEIRLPIPDGADFVGSIPPAQPENGQLIFPFGTLAVGQSHSVQMTLRARKPGAIKSVAMMRTAEGYTDQREVDTAITTPQLKVELNAPQTGAIDTPIRFGIKLTNPGTGPIDEILLIAEFDPGFEHEKAGPKPRLESKARGLAPGESREESVILTPRKLGPLGLRVTASGAGQLASDQRVVLIQQPKVSLRVDGPVKRYVGRPAEWKIFVKNDSDAEQQGVTVKDRLPPELRFIGGTRNPTHSAGDVVWNLGALKPGEEVVLELATECVKANPAAEKSTFLLAPGLVPAQQTRRISIEGIAALKMEMAGTTPVEVGKIAVYRMVLTNTGSSPAKNINVKATLPIEFLKAIKASGPTRETIGAGFVSFDRVAALPPGERIIFEVHCQALKETRDARFQVQYTSDLNTDPLLEQESTTIIAPAGDPPPIPPPPPGGGVPMPLPPG